MNKIENPCENVTDTKGWKSCSACEYCDEVTPDYLCPKNIEYQARIQQQAEDWEHIGEEFFEPVVNLYVKPEYKEFVSELWQRIKEGRC